MYLASSLILTNFPPIFIKNKMNIVFVYLNEILFVKLFEIF